jgi:hypothetical protein
MSHAASAQQQQRPGARATGPGLDVRLRGALTHLAPCLATQASRARLLRAASAAPPLGGVGLEARLDDPSRLDLCLRFAPGEHGIALAHGLIAAPPAAGATLYVEFDLPDGGRSGHGLFVGAGDGGLGRPAIGTSVHEVLAGADWLAGGRLEDANRAFLAARLALLPPALWVGYVGRFPHRDPRVLRVTMSGLELAAVPDFLGGFGLPDVARLPRILGGLAVRTVLALDLRDGAFCGGAGIEVSPRAPLAWPPLLQRLTEDGLLSAEQAAALAAWPGLERARGEVRARRLNHLKFVHRRGGPATAKAYLYLAAAAANQLTV